MKTIRLSGRSKGDLNQAARIIRAGGLVAFPTETVYGLGANALDPNAIGKIFEAKKRPFNDPLIVHVCDLRTAFQLMAQDDSTAKLKPLIEQLAKRFWPGPLTIVVKKSKVIPLLATAGKNTVAIRMPDNAIALQLIKAAGVPIAAPSANLFSRPSPTSMAHVLEDLEGRIDAILDGGNTKIGLESTILDLSGYEPRILRPGKIGINVLKSIFKRSIETTAQSEFPGGMKKHYSPKARLRLITSAALPGEIKTANQTGKSFGVIANNSVLSKLKLPKKKLQELSMKNLYRALRYFDKEKVQLILAVLPTRPSLNSALLDRLEKAAS